MKPETFDEAIEQLEASGWQADNTPQAVEKQYAFESFADTLNFLIEVGAAAEGLETMPSIHIDDGVRLAVRIGRPPVPALSAGEIELAKALPTGPQTPETQS